MDNLDIKTPIQPDADDLRLQFDALRHLVVSILILVVVMSGTFNIYLLRQWRTTTRELAEVRPQVAQMIAAYQNQEGPWFQEILKRFNEYGRTHPDFAVVLAKHGIKPPVAVSAAPPATPISPSGAKTKK